MERGEVVVLATVAGTAAGVVAAATGVVAMGIAAQSMGTEAEALEVAKKAVRIQLAELQLTEESVQLARTQRDETQRLVEQVRDLRSWKALKVDGVKGQLTKDASGYTACVVNHVMVVGTSGAYCDWEHREDELRAGPNAVCEFLCLPE